MAIKMLKPLKLSLVLIASMTIAGTCTAATNPSNVKTTYQSSTENFPNPERGFYKALDPSYTPSPPLQMSELQQVRKDNMSTIRRIYLLSEFRDKPISQSYLDMISNDCATARKAGVKMIIRFTYNWMGGGPDAPRDRILSHLDQLKPILQANYDVIAYMEAGFVGKWGEWHSSTNNLFDSNWALNVTDDTKKIFSKILSVLPTERMVALRYSKHKKQIHNNNSPLTSAEAFNGSGRARTGAYNDCFLASSDDWGTYSSTDPSVVESEKNFLNLDNRYVVQGGETCNSNSEAQSYIVCSNALNELARMRWSALNSYNVGYGDGFRVLETWQKNGCMPEIQRRLGYRFRLLNSSIPDRVKPAGTFSISFKVTNDGWAGSYNPRNLEVILRNRETGQKYYLSVPEAVRMWMPGETKTVDIVSGIPATMPPGEYQVLLNLPDPASRLYKRPEYAIRLANQNVWEATTGYNSLLRTVIVDPNAGGNAYSGNQLFTAFTD